MKIIYTFVFSIIFINCTHTAKSYDAMSDKQFAEYLKEKLIAIDSFNISDDLSFKYLLSKAAFIHEIDSLWYYGYKKYSLNNSNDEIDSLIKIVEKRKEEINIKYLSKLRYDYGEIIGAIITKDIIYDVYSKSNSSLQKRISTREIYGKKGFKYTVDSMFYSNDYLDLYSDCFTDTTICHKIFIERKCELKSLGFIDISFFKKEYTAGIKWSTKSYKIE